MNKSLLKEKTLDKYKILVVEDDDCGYLLIDEILSSHQINLHRAVNGQEAIDSFEKNETEYDLVLMDIRMPKVNGYEATQKIKEINPKVPIIAVTAFAHSQGVIDCFNSGCDDFIAKPFDVDKIVQKIENYLMLRN